MVYATTTSLVSLVLLLSMNSHSMGQVIDCNGLTCSNYDPWTEINSAKHTIYGDCSISINFRYTQCCNPGCQYIIEITEVSYSNDCDLADESWFMNEAIKFAIMKLDMDVNIPGNPHNFDLWVKTYSCFSESVPEGTLTPCGSECCVTKYSITKEPARLLVFNQINYLGNSPQEFCNGTCNSIFCNHSHMLTSNHIYYSDYLSNEICELDCFWKLSGNNNVTPNSFIGPTNGEDFVVKTFNSSQNKMTERIRVSSNSAIDFKFNSWFTMPQISFDSPLFGNDFYGDPLIKYYRPTGDPEINGLYPAYPWWIGVNVETGLPTEAQASFNIFSGPSSIPGQENQSMTRRLTILRNGNVGIGVVNPATELAVAGTICAEEVRVSLSGAPCWPDYVFNENYQLQSLEEIEKFIKQNKHLPNLPTSEEVSKNGIELGVMNTILLQKIEELTLHLIQLKKENAEIKKIINKE